MVLPYQNTAKMSYRSILSTISLFLILAFAQLSYGQVPVITSNNAATATAGVTFTFPIVATQTPNSYGETGVLPSGLTLNTSNGVIYGTTSSIGISSLNLSATNNSGTGYQDFTLTVNPPAPTVTSPLTATATVNSNFLYTITGTNSPTVFTTNSLPTNLTLNASTGIISGLPTTNGSYSISLTAGNVTGNSSPAILTLNVSPQPPPVITSPLTVTATVNSVFTYNIAATNFPTGFGAVGLPSVFTLDPVAGIITGTPNLGGSAYVTINASNSTGTSPNASLSIIISAAITSPQSVAATLSSPFSYSIIANNIPSTYTLTGTLPSGLTFNPNTGAITGTPTMVGTYALTMGATFLNAPTITQSLVITVSTTGVTTDGYVFTVSGGTNQIIGYTGNSATPTIPSTINTVPVTSIAPNAFIPTNTPATTLTGITIPSTVVSIGANAFNGCNQLTSATLSNALNTIPLGAFANCTSLASIVIPNSVSSIGVNAFGNCTALASVTFPTNLVTIGDAAFQNCSSLTTVALPTGLTTIEQQAFSGCTALTTVTLPSTLINFGNSGNNWLGGNTGVFYNCPNLATLTCAGNAPLIAQPFGNSALGDFAGDNKATFFYQAGATGWTPVFDGIPAAVVGTTSMPNAMLVSAFNGSAIISFTPPTTPGNSAITNYLARATPVNGGITTSVTGNASPLILNNLTNGTTYAFTVAAVSGNSVGVPASTTAQVAYVAIASQPATQNKNIGDSATFTVTAISPNTLSYQWYLNGNIIAGATYSSLTIGSVQASNAGAYTVLVSSNSGSVTSNAAYLSINSLNTPPSIISQPLTQTVAVGSSTSVGVVATGTAPLTFQWYLNGAPVIGATTSTYSIPSFQVANAGGYTVIVSNAYGSIISNLTPVNAISQTATPRITAQPASQSLQVGAKLNLAVAIVDNLNVTYQWYFNGNPIIGATNATYSIPTAVFTNTGIYTVAIIYSGGTLVSAPATVMVTASSSLATITSQPISQVVNTGSSVLFSVTATGYPNLTYQWLFNGNPVNGANSNYYSITNAQLGNTGTYSVSIGYPGGSILSNNATLTVQNPYILPIFNYQPISQVASVGSNVNFIVSASGFPVPTYQWYFNGSPIAGATSSTLALNNLSAAKSGSYTVTASNSAGNTYSTAALLTVISNGSPKIINQPNSHDVSLGSTVSFQVTATAGQLYQWYLNGFVVSGATSSTFVTTATNATQGIYQCLVQNNSGATLSNPSTLQIAQTTNTGHMINFSVLNSVSTSYPTLTIGFVTNTATSNSSQTVLIRGIGPALAAFNVANPLPDPLLSLFSGQYMTAQNYGWGSSPANQLQVIAANANTSAFALTNTLSLDSAIVVPLTPGAYTTQLTSLSGKSGSVLAEVYDNSSLAYTSGSQHLTNLSCLQYIQSNASITAGFVITGTTAETVLIRACGPSLASFGVTKTMPDPQLSLYNSSKTVIASNTGWGGNQAVSGAITSTGAFNFSSSTSLDSALLITLDPGAYSVISSSASGVAGFELIEVYEVK